VADRVIVQYAGRQVETQDAARLFTDPHHPYTSALLASLPEHADKNPGRRLLAIPGLVPGQWDRPGGCLFAPRCEHAFARCLEASPPPASDALGRALCFTPLSNGVPSAAAAEVVV
jgi:dipeptide transport system ATP-binding protein